MRTALAGLCVALAAALSGCRPGAPPPDSSYRTRDAALLDAFADLEGRCAPSWSESPECLARLRQLSAEEKQLFADVRAHWFASELESNYWHRGRLKFPSAIAQALERAGR